MSLTKVTYSMISGAPANVMDYGADPTGATNSNAAIQLAIDSGAATVVFAEGTYLIDPTVSRIYLRDDLTLDLCGSTVLISADHYVNGVICTVQNPFSASGTQTLKASKNIRIQNGTFKGQSTYPGSGNRVPTAEIENLFILGAFFDSPSLEVSNVVFDGVSFERLNGSAITSYQGEQIKVLGCNFKDIFVDQGQANGCAVQFQGVRESIINTCTGTHDDSNGESWHFAIAVTWTTGSKNIIFSDNVIQNWTGGHMFSCEANDVNLPNFDIIIANNTGLNITGGSISNVKGSERVIIDGNTITNSLVGVSATQAYDVKIVNNYFRGVALSCINFENCFSNATITNNTMRSVGGSGDTANASFLLKGNAINYITTGTVSSFEPDTVIVSGNDIEDVNGAGIFVSRTGGNISLRGTISNNVIRNFGTQSSGAATRSLIGILGNNCVIQGNVIQSNSSTSELAILSVFASKACVDNVIEGTYTLGYYSCGGGKSVWTDTNYWSPVDLRWIAGQITAKEASASITLGSAKAPYDAGDVAYYTDPQTAGYIGAVRMTDGIAAGGWNSFGALVP
jgi:hypothetical protein